MRVVNHGVPDVVGHHVGRIRDVAECASGHLYAFSPIEEGTFLYQMPCITVEHKLMDVKRRRSRLVRKIEYVMRPWMSFPAFPVSCGAKGRCGPFDAIRWDKEVDVADEPARNVRVDTAQQMWPDP